jgi:hypothetical protein
MKIWFHILFDSDDLTSDTFVFECMKLVYVGEQITNSEYI